jgi:HEAT repeat protein
MATVAELVAQLGSDDLAQVSQARQQLRSAAYRVSDPKKLVERNALADELVIELTATVAAAPNSRATNVPDSEPLPPVPKHSAAARRFVCQLLNQSAGDPQVPKLTPLLADLEIRDAVRCVLESIPTLVSTMALLKGLAETGPEFRIGVINALGRERWREAMAALMRLANDPDPEVHLAALEGLANFPEAANDKLFVAATQTGTPRERSRAQAARVRLAETLHGFGEAQAAGAIYRSIAADAAEGPWKRAARLASG